MSAGRQPPATGAAADGQTPLMEAPAAYVGQSVLRIEDRPLLTGGGAFLDDVHRPGQVHARVVRSPVAHGRIARLDVEPARGRADVVAVLTAADLPEDLRIPIRLAPSPAAARAVQPPLARDVVRYVGEPVAVVVAATPYAAEDAAGEVRLDVEPLPAVLDATTASEQDAAVHEAVPGNVTDTVRVRWGEDADALFAAADVVVRERLAVHRHTAVPLETRGLLAELDPRTGALTVWGPTKVKHYNRRVLAEMLGLPLERLRFVEPDVGGGFGVRGELYPEDVVIPWLALRLGRAVKWVEDRQEHFLATNHSREQVCEIELAADGDGRLLGLRATAWVDIGAYVRTNGPVVVLNTVTHLAGPYQWRSIDVAAHGVLTNKTPVGTYRGPGQYEAALHRERMIDVVAGRVGLDPAELRRRNLIPRERLPYRIELEGIKDPVVYDSGDFPLLWSRLEERAGYAELRRETERERAAGRLTGVGVATFVEAGGRGPYEWARVVPQRDGGFVVHAGTAALGQGIATGLAQIAADALDVPIGRVRVAHKDTGDLEDGAGAFASRSVVFSGNAVAGAVRDLLVNARAGAARRLEVDEDAVELVAGGIARERGRPERGVSFAELGCEGAFRFEKHHRSWSMGAALALVDVDRETGEVRVRRCVVACDVGRAVNPLLVEGQLVGAAAQGIGGILLEALAYDDQGQPVTTSFMDYCLPTAGELPVIEAVVLELPQHDPASANPLGAKGAGEAGIVGIGAAVANAVADALGGDVVVADLPIAPETVLSLLDRRHAEGVAA